MKKITTFLTIVAVSLMPGILCGSEAPNVSELMRQAAAHQKVGKFNLAEGALRQVLAQAEQQDDKALAARVKNNLASIWILGSKKYRSSNEEPDVYLLESLAVAEENGDKDLETRVRINLGNLLIGWTNYEDAAFNFLKAAESAAKLDNNEMEAHARVGLAMAAAYHGAGDMAEENIAKATALAKQFKGPAEQTMLHSKAAHIYGILMGLAADDAGHRKYLAKSGAAYQQAIRIAREAGDEKSQAYNLGYLADLYQIEGRHKEALTLCRSALRLAQKNRLLDAVYQWQWQAGRLHRALGDSDRAIEAYKGALENLQSVRSDLAIIYGSANSPTTFRESVGPVFFELADLLLQKASQETNLDRQTALLLEARDTVETLKTAELSNYFQDDCVYMVKDKAKDISQLSGTACIVYIVPLNDRVELLLSLPSGIRRETVKVSSTDLMDQARQFRYHVERRTTYFYKDHAKKLYEWLVAPIEKHLKGIDTLVFVPDGALRTIPMAALFDGEKYLMEKYAVAVTPGLTLMESSQPIAGEQSKFLFSGVSEARQGFPALPAVKQEAEKVGKSYEATMLMDKAFLKQDIIDQFAKNDYRIVHIASHGQFSGDAENTFVMTYDDFLTLDDLENLIRPSSYRGAPVELLTLSACQTAAGDDKAALGLAGVAIKAGARSAMASLWFVSDQASAVMVDEFYKNLSKGGISKARALQQAQKQLRNDPRFRHPRYWAPYILIGNWL